MIRVQRTHQHGFCCFTWPVRGSKSKKIALLPLFSKTKNDNKDYFFYSLSLSRPPSLEFTY